MSTENKYIPQLYSSVQLRLNEWLNSFSSHLKVKAQNNKIQYPDNFASGFAKVHAIEPGLEYRIVDYSINTDFIFSRQPSEEFFLIIYFYQYTNAEKLFLTINDEVILDTEDDKFSAVLMTNSLVSQQLELKSGTIVKGLTIHLSEQWLREKIEGPGMSNMKRLRERDFFKNFLNAKSQKLLNEIFEENSQSPIPALYMNTRVLRLLEEFLKNLLRMDASEYLWSISNEDFQSIIKIEALLLESYNVDFPKIEKLARIALMSETKLKSIFKKAFGMGLYEYYQKNRMHKAKQLLNANKLSVSEVGSLIGYHNLSNFSNAFKKEFGHLPKDCRRIG